MLQFHKKIIFKIILVLLIFSVFTAGFSFEIICPLQENKCIKENIKSCCNDSTDDIKPEQESECFCEMKTKKSTEKINKKFISNLPTNNYEPGQIQINDNLQVIYDEDYNLFSKEIVLNKHLYLTQLNLRI